MSHSRLRSSVAQFFAKDWPSECWIRSADYPDPLRPILGPSRHAGRDLQMPVILSRLEGKS